MEECTDRADMGKVRGYENALCSSSSSILKDVSGTRLRLSTPEKRMFQ